MAQKKTKQVSLEKVCDNCHAIEGSLIALKLSACARCGLALYCSKDCQRAHWKVNHKNCCVAKADRAPQCQEPLFACNGAASRDIVGDKCSICLDSLAAAQVTTLQCAHIFHIACVSELRKFGVTQACPLCRTPLLAGPEKVCEEASRRYLVVDRMVARGEASWSALPAAAQHEVDEVVTGWRTAADQGHAEAQNYLGYIFDTGRGVKKKYVEAAQWYMKSANQGYGPAQYSLGHHFASGRGVEESHTEAAHWFRKAADQGIAEAQCKYATLFMAGRGVMQSDVEAALWLKKAADQGDEEAQVGLGIKYEDGCGVVKSAAEAAR